MPAASATSLALLALCLLAGGAVAVQPGFGVSCASVGIDNQATCVSVAGCASGEYETTDNPFTGDYTKTCICPDVPSVACSEGVTNSQKLTFKSSTCPVSSSCTTKCYDANKVMLTTEDAVKLTPSEVSGCTCKLAFGIYDITTPAASVLYEGTTDKFSFEVSNVGGSDFDIVFTDDNDPTCKRTFGLTSSSAISANAAFWTLVLALVVALSC